MREHAWGIDLGGTKIEGVILDRHLKPLIRKRIATESEKGYEHIIHRIGELLQLLQQETGLHPDRIGMGTPGISDPHTGLMKNCNTTALIGKPFQMDIEKLFNVPVLLSNDANCFTLAEYKLGAGRGAQSVFGVIMGTGVGGGLIHEGKEVKGAHGIAGEWGHTILLEEGPRCYCGRYGCVETFLSGPALERFYESLSKSRCTLPEIAEKARDGEDKAAVATLMRLTELFGRAISTVVNIFDPEVIVLGGGVSNLEVLYNPECQSLKRHIFNDSVATRIVKHELGDSAGVFGAALLVQ